MAAHTFLTRSAASHEMTVKMRVLVVLGLWLAVCEAILVRSAGNTSAVDTSAVRDNREIADQITPQESNERLTFYADHYPGKMFSTFLTHHVLQFVTSFTSN